MMRKAAEFGSLGEGLRSVNTFEEEEEEPQGKSIGFFKKR